MNYIEKWEDYLINDDKSNNTVSTYMTGIKQFLKFVNKPIEEVTKQDTVNYKKHMEDKGDSIKTINQKCIIINSYIGFLNDIHDKGILVKARVEKTQSQEFLDNPITKEEFERITECAKSYGDYRTYTVLYALYYTGARVSEILQLKVTDIENYVSIKGKGSKHRDLFITDDLIKILNRYIKYHRKGKESRKLFITQKGDLSRYTIDKNIKKYAQLSGVDKEKAHAHNLRHLFCMSMADRGFTLDTIADLAGHSSINTTRIYTRKTKADLLKAMSGL